MTGALPLSGVIFDLGGTLFEFMPGGDWQDMEELGATGWHAYLVERGYPVPELDAVKAAVWAQMQQAWYSIGQGSDGQLGLANQLRLAARRLGFTLALADYDASVRRFVTPVQQTIALIPGAVETLHALKARRLRLGLISNTMWPGASHCADLERFGLLDAFEPGALFFSDDEGIWKPDPEIFRRALAALDLRPAEAVYVGDSLALDIRGAHNAGMRGVWVENAEPYSPEAIKQSVQPDAQIQHLRDLIPIIDTWRSNL
ncbi:MAG: HAD family hydrolase [Anaerolineae bacterium]|nr:HAD family hydrolase [Anaerolineae bacterium]